ncbi:Uncharacterised protein [uncultured archaeon]|nr:Uncharacterised protein [uncultured archaeon]
MKQKNKKKQESFFKKKKVISVFAIISLVAGVGFLNKTMTGNAVLNQSASIQFTPLIGIALIICSGILSAYIIFRR